MEWLTVSVVASWPRVDLAVFEFYPWYDLTTRMYYGWPTVRVAASWPLAESHLASVTWGTTRSPGQ